MDTRCVNFVRVKIDTGGVKFVTVKIDTRGVNFDNVKIDMEWVKFDKIKIDTGDDELDWRLVILTESKMTMYGFDLIKLG